MTIWVRCDDCPWTDTVSTARHLRAWFHVACPSCGRGEVIDASERRVVEEILAMEAEGLVEVVDVTAPIPSGKVLATLNTARDPMLTFHPKVHGQ